MVDPKVAAVLLSWHELDAASSRTRKRFAQESGVPATDFFALLLLARYEGAPMGVLTRELGFSSGAMTALADRLEAAGFVARSAVANDRRTVSLVLSATGHAVIQDAISFYETISTDLFSPTELVQLARYFRAIARRLGDEDNGHRAGST